VESTINYSERDLARGAVDLVMDEQSPIVTPNTTVIGNAVNLVREAAPKIIETIVSHLAPPLPSSPSTQQVSLLVPNQDGFQTLFSPPVETVVVVGIPTNNTLVTPSIPTATVRIYYLLGLAIFFVSKISVFTILLI
jgi:hypothetical protein